MAMGARALTPPMTGRRGCEPEPEVADVARRIEVAAAGDPAEPRSAGEPRAAAHDAGRAFLRIQRVVNGALRFAFFIKFVVIPVFAPLKYVTAHIE